MSSTGIEMQEVFLVPLGAKSTDDRMSLLGGRSSTGNIPFKVSSTGEIYGARTISQIDICTSADISGNVNTTMPNFDRYTLYLNVGATMSVKVELSPDGTNYYDAISTAVNFASTGDDIINFDAKAKSIQLSSTSTANVTAQLRGDY